MIFYNVAVNNIKIAINTLDKLSDNEKFDEMDIDISMVIINAISSISNYYERIDKSVLSPNQDLWFRAYAYVNNQVKHDIALEIIHYPVFGSAYPMGYPMIFDSPGVCWNDFVDNGSIKARGKRNHYDACLCDEDIAYTFSRILEIIERVEYIKRRSYIE